MSGYPAPALFLKEEIMFQFNYKLKIAERVKAKCERHPRYNPERDGHGGIKGGCSNLLLSFRSASGEAIAGRRTSGVSKKGIALDAGSLTSEQAAVTKAERTTYARIKPLSRGLRLQPLFRPSQIRLFFLCAGTMQRRSLKET
jgi:hypothetical protein